MRLFRGGYLRHVAECIRLLSLKARFLYLMISIGQALLSVLDLVGLALIMKIIIGFQAPGENSSSAVKIIPFLDNLSGEQSSQTLLTLVVTVFVLKSVGALSLHTLTIKLMASETVKLVNVLNRTIFENRTSRFKRLSNQDISYSIYNAADIVFRDTLVPVSVISADVILLLVVGLNLFISAQVLFFPTMFYFLGIFVVLRTFERRSARSALKIQMQNEILGRGLVQETATSLRELNVFGKLNWMTDKIFSARASGIDASSTITIGQLRPKYFYEMALFAGIGVISVVSLLTENSASVLTFLALFLISASRMIPSLLRIQYYLGTFQKSQEQTRKIFDILEIASSVIEAKQELNSSWTEDSNLEDFSPEISVKNVSFSYDGESKNVTINDVSFEISPGQMVAIVGPSGSGKSTLADLILGYQHPSSGEVQISGIPPKYSFQRWPGEVSYVPQKVTIYQGSLFSNITLGDAEAPSEAERLLVEHLVYQVGLGDFLSGLNNGLNSILSELGSTISGGQVQRIGIARALYANPSIILFDESTSSLDSSSEEEIMQILLAYKGVKTMIFIAHRLSTIQNADRIFYLSEGRVIAEGTFLSLQDLVPEFKQQVMHLNIGMEEADSG